ncbi:MAG: enoyl-CoA hydratase/isomerase family protein [Myxococcota bacterium]
MSSERAVYYERNGWVGQIVLNRPDNRNSMTGALLDAFALASEEARKDAEARCIVIRGMGRCFSAGADFRDSLQRDKAHRTPSEKSYAMYEPFLSVLDIEVPVIGALQGHAVGGGFGLALVCDLRVGCRNSKYGANFAKIGLHSGMAISYLLPRLVGVAHAADLLFTARLIDGETAGSIGLFNHVADSSEAVLEHANSLAHAISANAPGVVRSIKRMLYDGLNWDPRRAARAEALAQAQSLETQDAVEGMNALLEKRPPSFRGS